jgi:hypothetical protein
MSSGPSSDQGFHVLHASTHTRSAAPASNAPSAHRTGLGANASPTSFRDGRGPIRISGVRFCRGSPAEIEHGLEGYISCVLNGAIGIDGLTLRRTQAGSLSISFPSRCDSRGRRHHSVWPKDRRAHYEIEQQILADLRRQCVLE